MNTIVDPVPMHYWVALEVVNVQDEHLVEGWIFGPRMEILESYVFPEGPMRASRALDSKLSIFFQLAPGDTATLFAKLKVTDRFFESALIVPGLMHMDRFAAKLVNHNTGYYTYAGVMLGLILMSLVLFVSLREKSFLLLSFVLLGFVGYIQNYYQVDGWLSFDRMGVPFWFDNIIGLLLMIPALTGYIYYYLDLNKRPFRLRPLFLGLPVLQVVAMTGAYAFIDHFGVLLSIANVVLFLWIMATAIIIIRAVRAGSREASILLIALSLLILGGAALAILLTFKCTVSTKLLVLVLQVGSVLFSGLIFYGLFLKVTAIRQHAREVESRQEFIRRFFVNITHELRTPLTLIHGPVERLLSRITSADDTALLRTIQRNAGRQLDMINQILDLSRLEANQLALTAVPVDVVPLLRRAVAQYESLAQQRSIHLSFASEPQTLVLSLDVGKFATVMQNLLGNAFKFTPGGGTITVTLSCDHQLAIIKVRDNGRGIDPADLPRIFERFFTSAREDSPEGGGSGIGLALTQELVRLHGGRITVASEPGAFTVFTVRLPYEPGLGATTLSEDQEVTPAALAAQVIDTATPGPGPEDAPLIVVVEDNADLRDFLTRCLSDRFRVRTAADGKQGLQLSEELAPELVISDVMMPNMDGFTLCARLKANVTTSHIPVILLTARAGVDSRVQGLETGADDYLTKPFTERELVARAQNLVRSRRLLRGRFAESIILQPEEVSASTVDQEFLRAAILAVQDNIDRVEFNIDALAHAVGMSRTNLNRKFRALLDQTSNQFIQHVRLERAADLLGKQDLTVGEVADRTGFNSTGYFIRCFKAKFGVTPGSFRKEGFPK
jgi:signal transduction histidine kinase/DNA-binding response OmpR family regulator